MLFRHGHFERRSIRRQRVGTVLLGVCVLALNSCAGRQRPAAPQPSKTTRPAKAKPAPPRDKLGIPWLPASVRAFDDEIVEAANNHGVDPQLLAIFILLESKGNPKAKGPGGASGLMQIMPSTGRRIAKKRGLRGHTTSKLMRPAYNLDIGAWYVAALQKSFPGSLDENVGWIAAAYNAGPGKVAAHRRGKAKLSARAQRYRKLVTALWRERNQKVSPTYERFRAGRY